MQRVYSILYLQQLWDRPSVAEPLQQPALLDDQQDGILDSPAQSPNATPACEDVSSHASVDGAATAATATTTTSITASAADDRESELVTNQTDTILKSQTTLCVPLRPLSISSHSSVHTHLATHPKPLGTPSMASGSTTDPDGKSLTGLCLTNKEEPLVTTQPIPQRLVHQKATHVPPLRIQRRLTESTSSQDSSPHPAPHNKSPQDESVPPTPTSILPLALPKSLRREASRLTLKRKSLSKKLKHAISFRKPKRDSD